MGYCNLSAAEIVLLMIDILPLPYQQYQMEEF